MVIDTYWHTDYDPLLEFWSVAYYDGILSHQMSACMSKEVAEHTVQIHNKWYQDQVYDGYINNVVLSEINLNTRAIIANCEDEDAQFWQDQILTDVAQLDSYLD